MTVITSSFRMLNTFVQQHSATPTRREPIAVTYLVTGVSHDANNNIDKVCQICCILRAMATLVDSC